LSSVAPANHSRTVWLQRAATVLVLVGLALLARRSATQSIDFPVYHRAAQQVLAGNYELYPAEAYGGQPHPSQGFRYAPAIAFLFLPLGWFSLETSAFLFFCLKLAALWWVGATIARRIGSTGWGRGAFLLAFLVVGGYLVEELRFGNAHVFVVALMVLAFDRTESGKVATPAIALAIAVATKLTPLALLAYFALRRRTAVCVATLVVLGALVLMPALVMGMTGNLRQLRAFATYAAEKVDEGDNYSLRGVLVRYLTPGLEDSSHIRANVADVPMSTVNVLWLGSLAVLGLASLAVMWRSSGDPVVHLLEFSIVMTGVVLASPHTQRRYYVALFVPVVVLELLWKRATSSQERRWIVTGVMATAAPATLLPLLFGGHRLALIYEAASPYTFGGIVLFGVLLALTHARKASATAPTVAGLSRAAGGNLSGTIGV
jgi:hypothetical protein